MKLIKTALIALTALGLTSTAANAELTPIQEGLIESAATAGMNGTRYNFEPPKPNTDQSYWAEFSHGYTYLPGDRTQDNYYGFCITEVSDHVAVAPFGHGPDYAGAGRPTCKTDLIEIFTLEEAYSWFTN